MAVDDHGGGVPHETDVDARGVDVDRRGVVVGGDDGDGLPAAVLPAEGGHRHAPRRRGLLRARPPVDGRFRQVAQQPPRQLPDEEGPPHGVSVVRSGGARERGRETVGGVGRAIGTGVRDTGEEDWIFVEFCASGLGRRGKRLEFDLEFWIIILRNATM